MATVSASLHDIQHRANLWLQIALFLNVYLSFVWAIIYGFHILWHISSLLRDFPGLCVVFAYVLALPVEIARLYAGYSGNLRARTIDLSIFLITSAVVQLPLGLFLFLTNTTTTITITGADRGDLLIKITMGSLLLLLLLLLLLELILGGVTWQHISKYQSELFRVRREICMEKQAAIKYEEVFE